MLVVLVLVGLNAFFVAAEYAFVSSRRTRIDALAEEGSTRARLVQQAKKDPTRFISVSQSGVTIMSLLLGALGEPTLEHVIEPVFDVFLPHEAAFISATSVSLAIALIVITYLEIVLGEQVPKIFALQKAEGTILFVMPIMRALGTLLAPLIVSIYWGTRAVLNVFGVKYQGEHSQVYTEDELRMLVMASVEKGVLEESEEEIINRVFNFTDLTAAQVMVPRTEMVCVPINSSLEEITKLAIEDAHTRFPVYDGTIDNIIGVVHTKDLLRVLALGRGARFSLRRILREVLVEPETKPLNDLLAEMRRRHLHMAIVIDEYGGTSGLVTMEDMLERLVGDVQDEFHPEEEDITHLPDGSLLINGLMSIDELNDALDLEYENPDYNTIGGAVFGELGRKPEVGDEVNLGFGPLTVEAMDGLRIASLRLRLCRHEQPEDEQEDDEDEGPVGVPL